MSIAHNMLQSGVRDLVYSDFAAAVEDVLGGGEVKLPYEEAGAVLDKYFQELQEENAAKEAEIAAAMKKEGEEFLAENAKKDGVIVLPSGLQYKMLKEGNDKMPSATSQVRCHYEGKFINGHVFDSSYKRGEPAVFGLNQVIAGWTEGLQLMGEGGICELYIPYELAYGEMGSNGAIPPCATLIFKVELLEVL